MNYHFSNAVTTFYRDQENKPKISGIFAPGLDRWILIDPYDFWMTLETAEILSSKIATMAYVIPEGSEIDNENCIDFTIFNKTGQKKAGVSDLITSQTPVLRILPNPGQIVSRGTPEDYKNVDGQSAIDSLKIFADYVHKCVYAANISQITANHYDNETFSTKYFSDSWTKNLRVYSDKSGIPNGVASEIKKILYHSANVAQIKQKIYELWKEHAESVPVLKNAFYRLLDEEQPEDIAAIK